MTSSDMQDTPAGRRVARADGPRSSRPRRRTFTAAYKLAMIEKYDAATLFHLLSSPQGCSGLENREVLSVNLRPGPEQAALDDPAAWNSRPSKPLSCAVRASMPDHRS